jgi:hypothetical protein
MIQGGNLILPYAMSDVATSIAVVDLGELLNALAAGAHGTSEARGTKMATR